MRIQNNANIARTSRGRAQKAKSSQTGFDVDQQTPTAISMPAAAQSEVACVDTLLALQAVDSPLQQRKKTITRGHDLLDQLEALKIDLLSGDIVPHKLNRLLQLIQTQRTCHEDGLDQLIDEIELRARVELAKYRAKYQ